MTEACLAEGIAISAWRDADTGGVLDLILPIQQSEFGVAVTAADQPDLMAVADFYQTGIGGFWCARREDKIVGTIALKDFGQGQLALRKMFVASAFRGAAYGIGQGLLDHAHAHARAAGGRKVWLGTLDIFRAACRFYEKNGFMRVDKADLPAAFPLMAVDTVFYGKAL